MLRRGRQLQHSVPVRPIQRQHIRHDRRTGRERAGLVQHDRVQRVGRFQNLATLDQYPEFRPATCADHDGRGCGQAHRAGAGHDEDGHGVDERCRESVAQNEPECEGHTRDAEDHGHEYAGHPVREPLDGRPGALGLPDCLYDPGQHGPRTDLFRHEDEAACPVDCGTDHARA